MDLVTLILPPGIDGYPISHNDQSFPQYRHDPNGPLLVDVPPDVASYLTHNAGFVPMAKSVEEPLSGNMTKLISPSGSGCCVGGGQYAPDEDGAVTVPAEYAAELITSHDFRLVSDNMADPRDAKLAKMAAELNASEADVDKILTELTAAEAEVTRLTAENEALKAAAKDPITRLKPGDLPGGDKLAKADDKAPAKS